MPGSDISELLYGLKIDDTSATPLWASDLEVHKLGTRGDNRRVKEALEGLKARYNHPSEDGVSRKLEEVYRRLVRSLDDNLEEIIIPVLVYARGVRGILKETRWLNKNDQCWFDDGQYQWALSAFDKGT